MALFGEAGPEAIMPLKRGPDGSLGVRTSGHSGGGNVTQHITIDARGADSGVDAKITAAMQKTKLETISAVNENMKRAPTQWRS
jgi:phage-related minor tail protein